MFNKKIFGILGFPIIVMTALSGLNFNSFETVKSIKNINDDFQNVASDVNWEQLYYDEYADAIHGEFTLSGSPSDDIEVVHINSSGNSTESFTPQYQYGTYSFTKSPFYDVPSGSSYYELETFEVYDGDTMVDSRNVSITNFDATKIVSDMTINFTDETFVILGFDYDNSALDIADSIGYSYSIKLYYTNGSLVNTYDVTSDEIKNDKVINGLSSDVSYTAEFYAIEDSTETENFNTSLTFEIV